MGFALADCWLFGSRIALNHEGNGTLAGPAAGPRATAGPRVHECGPIVIVWSVVKFSQTICEERDGLNAAYRAAISLRMEIGT
jgi:hypothetical protein